MADRKITELTELTTPVSDDVFPVIDSSEAANADKNKKITFETLHNRLPSGTAGSPAVAFSADGGVSGIYRSAANEVGFAANSTYQGAFTPSGLKLGTGTESAQLHLFSNDETDQVIVENSSDTAVNAPDVVLYRNSASPAADDALGNIEFRGQNDVGGAHNYAQIVASIEDTADGSEDGILDLMTSAAGTTDTRLRLRNNNVGIGELAPEVALHVTTTTAGTAIESTCTLDGADSGGDITLFHRRGTDGAGQANDVLSSINFNGFNDAVTPDEITYAQIEGSIVDPSDTSEDGSIKLNVSTGGTIETQLEVSGRFIGFFGATAAAQSFHVADAAVTYTANDPGATSGAAITIADGNAVTNAELLNYCRLLENKVNALLAFASAHGLMASS